MLKAQREAATPELGKLLADVTRWRYGQKAHLESSLEALKLWDEDNPQLEEIEELCPATTMDCVFASPGEGVPLERWQDRKSA